MKSGTLNSWNPQGLSRPVMGLLYLYLYLYDQLWACICLDVRLIQKKKYQLQECSEYRGENTRFPSTRTEIDLFHQLLLQLGISTSYGAEALIRVTTSQISSPISILCHRLQLHVWNRKTASFSTLFCPLLRGLPTGHFPPKRPPEVLFGIR